MKYLINYLTMLLLLLITTTGVYAQLEHVVNSPAGGGTGDPLSIAFDKVNYAIDSLLSLMAEVETLNEKNDSIKYAGSEGSILIKVGNKWLSLDPSTEGYFLESGDLPRWASINDAVSTAPAVVANTAKRSYPVEDEEKLDSFALAADDGAIMIKSNDKWVGLSPSSEGYFLESGALPSWASINDAVSTAPAVVANTAKRSYPVEDEEKLDSFALAADDGAIMIKSNDKWVGLSPSSEGYFLESGALPSWASINDAVSTAPAVVANTAKRSYPVEDEEKLDSLSLAADDGAIMIKSNDKWVGLDPYVEGYFLASGNLPSWASIDETVAEVPEVVENTAKRSYPEEDEEKLFNIEEDATADQTGDEIEALINAQIERQLKAALDTIFDRFDFFIDSVYAKQMLVADSIKIKGDANVIKQTNAYVSKSYESMIYETFNIEEMVWDTIYFQDGTKLWTGQ